MGHILEANSSLASSQGSWAQHFQHAPQNSQVKSLFVCFFSFILLRASPINAVDAFDGDRIFGESLRDGLEL